MLVCDKAHTMFIYNAETLDLVREEPTSLQSMPTACAAGSSLVSVGCKSGEIVLYPPEAMTVTCTLKDYHIAVTSLAFQPQQTDDSTLVSCHEDGTVVVWSIKDKSIIQKVKLTGQPID